MDFLSVAWALKVMESSSQRLVAAILRIEAKTIHAQTEGIGITDCRSGIVNTNVSLIA